MNDRPPVVIVTGSSGLIGKGVVRRLAEKYHVVGLDIVPPREPLPERATFIECDLSEQASVDRALADVRERHGEQIASVVHLAAYVDFSGEPSDKYEQITVRGTERLLNGIQNWRVEQFVFSSTMLVHAPTEPGKPINEDSPVEASWDYPASKVRTERIILDNHDGIPVVLLRLAGVYDDDGHSLPLAHQLQRIYEKQITARVFPGDVSHGQSLVHYDDLVESIWLTVERRQQLPDVLPLLIGEPDTVSYDELQRTFSSLIHGEPWETRKVPKPIARTGAWLQEKTSSEEQFIKPWMIDRADDHYELDISRARQTIDWEPKHSLRDALPKMVEALMNDPAAWYEEHKLTKPGWLERRKAG